MKKLLVAIIVMACTIGPIAGAFFYESVRTGDITHEIIARAPARGNFWPRKLEIHLGQEVKLRIRNVDTVTHGFAIPALGIQAGDIKAGHQAVVRFTADTIGKYDFYCTAWCSEHHLQMRGIIEVVGESTTAERDRGARQ